MTSMQMGILMRYIVEETIPDLTDDDVIDQFLTGREIDSNHAIRILLKHHGPMVLGVCRQVLDREADAEDTFQLTFLILARKAASVRNQANLGAWLHEVAYGTALKMRVGTNHCRSLERQSMMTSPSEFMPDGRRHDAAWNELRPVLHDEVHRLPDKYRVPIILSFLQGKTNEEVAELLQWPIGTVRGRLLKARSLLRSRLLRRGMALSAAFLFTALADGAVFAEVVPPELVERTVHFVQRFKGVAPSPGSTRSPRQPSTDSTFPRVRSAMFDVLRIPPNFFGLSLVVLIALSSVAALIGMGVAFGGNGNLSHIRSAISAFVGTRAAATSCP
jgi:RNA polymerase sigma factor (sigma-70 family)